MNNPNTYEVENMSDVLGETLRPGEFKLTQKAIELCNFTSQDKILDLGCGMGATISYLYNKYNIKAVGIDASEKLLSIAKTNCDCADFVKGSGEALPFTDESFDCVIAECTLSFTNDLNASIQEVDRVLKKKGWFVVADVYFKNPDAIKRIKGYSLSNCMKEMHDLDELHQKIEMAGLKSIYLGDYTYLLKNLLRNTDFSHGTVENLGYFILIAVKEE